MSLRDSIATDISSGSIIDDEVEYQIKYYEYATNTSLRLARRDILSRSPITTKICVYKIFYLDKSYIVMFYDVAANIESMIRNGLAQLIQVIDRCGISCTMTHLVSTEMESPYTPIEISSLLIECNRAIPSKLQKYMKIILGARIYRLTNISTNDLINLIYSYESTTTRLYDRQHASGRSLDSLSAEALLQMICSERCPPPCNTFYRNYLEYKQASKWKHSNPNQKNM